MVARTASIDEKLHRYHWYECIWRETGWSHAKISRFPAVTGDSKIALNWKRREHPPSDESIDRLRPEAPHSSLYYDCAPYRLLADKPLTANEIEELISVYRCEPGSSLYTFPTDPLTTIRPAPETRFLPENAAVLLNRGDIYAFFAQLAHVRDAEAKGDEIAHLNHLRWVYRCLPALGRDARFRPDFGLLCEAIENLHARVERARHMLGVDWDIITDQFENPDFEPDPQKQRKDPVTHMPMANADPTFLIKARHRGHRPAWVGHATERTDKPASFDATNLRYDEMLRMDSDQLLFFSFLQTMRLWEVKRSDWESVLGVDAASFAEWFYYGVVSIGFLPRLRSIALTIIKGFLHQDPRYRADWCAVVRSPRPTLDGQSILDYLLAGRVLDLLTDLDMTAKTSHSDDARGILPLVPAGVLGSREELFRDLHQFIEEFLLNPHTAQSTQSDDSSGNH